MNEGSEGGFWTGVVTSVSHIFSGEGEDVSSGKKVSEIEKKISDEGDLMQIDVSNEDLQAIQEQYDVTTVPFLIIFKRGVVVLKEVPTHETHDKVLQILDINPAAVHIEESKEEVATPAEATVTTAPAPTVGASLPVRPASDSNEKYVTLAPGERYNGPVEDTSRPPNTHNTTNIDRLYIHQKCTDVTTPEEYRRGNWRKSPNYISNLEDFQLPEDWWRNGYIPITDNSTEEIHYSRDVLFTEQETIDIMPTQPVVVPRPPVRPPHVVPAPMVRQPHLNPAHVVRPNIKPSVVQTRIAPTNATVKPTTKPKTAPTKPTVTTKTAPVRASSKPTVTTKTAPVKVSNKPKVTPVKLTNSTASVRVGNSTSSVVRPQHLRNGSRTVQAAPIHSTRVSGPSSGRVVAAPGGLRPVSGPIVTPTYAPGPVRNALKPKSAATETKK